MHGCILNTNTLRKGEESGGCVEGRIITPHLVRSASPNHVVLRALFSQGHASFRQRHPSFRNELVGLRVDSVVVERVPE